MENTTDENGITLGEINLTSDVSGLTVNGEFHVNKKRTKKDFVRELPKNYSLRVASSTNVNNLAKTIIGCIKDFLRCELICIGAGANWVATKAYVVAKGELSKYNHRLKYEAGFVEPRVVIDGVERTGVRIVLVTEEIE
jgi:stage V sporulation protein SpoVS